VRARSTARNQVRRRLLAAVVGAFAAILCGGPATALAGPGVLMRQGSTGEQIAVSGAQISQGANSGPTTYTVRENPGDPPRQITLRGMTMARLLDEAGFNPRTVKYVIVVGDEGPNITVTSPEILGGTAIVADSGAATRFFRPARGAGGTSDLVESAPGVPLEMTVNGGSLLSVRATATPTNVRAGESVRFQASIRFKPPGANYTYTWDFGDGDIGNGASVTHTFKTSGVFPVSVNVQGSGGYTADCSTICGGTQNVQVTVTGEVRDPDEAAGAPGGSGTTGGLGGTGQGGTGTGSGTGDGFGDATGATGTVRKPAKEPPPLKAVRPDPDSPFSSDPESGAGKTVVQGVLLAGPGAKTEVTLPDGTAGGSPKAAKGVPGVVENPSQLGLALAVALTIVLLGALQERRRVRLRVA
jgi:hypothetical protein